MDTTMLPIDIHYNKLLDWLLSRRHCDQHWPIAMRTVRLHTTEALQMALDAGFADAGSYIVDDITYFDCKTIFNELLKTENNSKTLFGNYQSAVLQKWSTLLRLYEDKNLLLADAAQKLVGSVNCDVSLLLKQQEKLIKQCDSLERKELELNNQAVSLKDKYFLKCKALNLAGTNIPLELLNQTREAEACYTDMVKSAITPLKEALDLYGRFISVVHNQNTAKLCPTLRMLINRGNITYFEFRTGQKPVHIIRPNLHVDIDASELVPASEQANQAESDDVEIDWGETADEQAVPGVEVLTTDITVESGENACIEQLAGQNDAMHDLPPTIGARTALIAEGKEALTMLEAMATRISIENELMELLSFLQQRISELTESQTAGGFDLTPFIVRSGDAAGGGSESYLHQALSINAEALRGYVGAISRLLAQLSSDHINHLYMLINFPSYASRFVAQLHGVRHDGERAAQLAALAGKRQLQIKAELETVVTKLAALRSRLVGLKCNVCQSISALYQGRPVNLIGEVNALLAA